MKRFILTITLLSVTLLGSSRTYLLTDGADSELCSGVILDPGGNQNYSNDLNITHVFRSDNGGQIQLNFEEFALALGDKLKIYNGPTASPSRLIGVYGASQLEGQTITSEGSGILTLVFTSNHSGNKAGFRAIVNCGYPCQDFNAYITSDHVITPVSKLLYTCPGETVMFNAAADFDNNNVNYTQSVGSSSISWINTHNGTTATGFSFEMPINEGFTGQLIMAMYDIQGCVDYDTITIVSQCPTMHIDLSYSATTSPDGTDEFNVASDNNLVFLANPSYGLDIEAEVTFEEMECYEPELTTIHWDYGHIGANGTANTLTPPTHFYPGINNIFYNLTVEAEDQRGCKTKEKVKVYIGCQPLKLEYTGTPGMVGNTIVSCPGDTISIGITTTPLLGDSLYNQAEGTLSYVWQTNGGNPPMANTENLDELVYDNSGYYDVLLTVSDQTESTANPPQRCSNELHIPIMQYIEPNLDATSYNVTEICKGDTVLLYGDCHLDMPAYNAPPTFLPDGSGQSYTSTLTYDVFKPDCVVENIDQINQICLTMEHSFLGDLEIELICPNGSSVLLKEYPGGGNIYLGEPIDTENADEVGVGYTYCFTPSGIFTLVNAPTQSSPENHDFVPGGDYAVADDNGFSDLVGCPLNGDWTIKVTDHMSIDDGWIFDWHFDLDGLKDCLLSDTAQFPFDTRVWSVYTADSVQNVLPADIITYYQDDAYAIPKDTGIYYFQYELETPANCEFKKIVGPIHVYPIPNFEISPDTNLCNTLEYNIDGYLEGGPGTWSYEGPAGLTFTRTDTIPTHVTVTQAGEYTLTFTPNTLMPKCGEPKSFKLSFRKLPEINAIIDSTECYGSLDGRITPVPLGEDQPYNYEWSNGSTQEIATGLGAGVYHVTVSSEYCDDVFQYVVQQPFPLEVGEYGYTDNLCFGENNGAVWGKTVGGTPPYSYNWSNGLTTDSITNLLSGNYNLTVTDAHGCQAYVTQNVGGPTAPLEAVFEEVKHINCFNDDNGVINLLAEGGTQPYSYAWTHNGNEFSTELNLSNLDQGEYKLTITDANGCKFKIDTIITEPTELQLLHEVSPATCNGVADGFATVYATEATPPYTYHWSNGSHEPTAVQLVSNFYNITVVDNNGCSKTINNIFIEQPNPVNITISQTDTICIGESVYMEISATSSPFTPYTFYWNGSESPAGITVSPSETTSYTAKVIDAHGCESILKEKVVNVHKDFSETTATLDKSEICRGEVVEVSIDGKGGNGNYTYQLANGTFVDSVFVTAPTTDGLINVTISDNCGTPPLTKSFEVEVFEPYDASFQASENIGCQPFAVQFFQDTTGHKEGTAYTWNMGYTIDGQEIISSQALPIHRFDSVGHYNISLEIISPQGCRSKISEFSYINVYPTPIAEFTPSHNQVNGSNPVVHFNNESQFASKYTWIFGDLDSTTVESPNFTFPVGVNQYEVMLIAENNYFCKDTAYSVIVVKDEIKLYIPTAFTPNGDGVNDKFKLHGNGIEDYQIHIYDRWGNLVYESKDLNESWNGTSRKGNKPLKIGTYSYEIKFTDTNGKDHKKAGRLNLIK